MAKLSTGQKRRQKELKRRKKKQLQARKQQASTSLTCTDLPSGLPGMSETLTEFAGTLLDAPEQGSDYLENMLTIVTVSWNIGAVTEDTAHEMRATLSESLLEWMPEAVDELEQYLDILITARRIFYADDPRFITSHHLTWTGPDEYFLQVASICLPVEERFSGRSAAVGLASGKGMGRFRVPPLTDAETQLKRLINRGFKLLPESTAKTGEDSNALVMACEIWLDAWEMIKNLYRDHSSLGTIDLRMKFILHSWSSDLDIHLLNAALAEPSLVEKGITFFREFLEYFPESEPDIHKSYRKALALLQFRARAHEEGDATFAALVKDYPDSTWSYIGWGDVYSPAQLRTSYGDVPADRERAIKIYQTPIDRELEHAEHARERLDQLLAFERDKTPTPGAHNEAPLVCTGDT